MVAPSNGGPTTMIRLNTRNGLSPLLLQWAAVFPLTENSTLRRKPDGMDDMRFADSHLL